MPEPVTLPALDEPSTVPPEAVDAFARDGHACLRGLASAEEIAAYEPIVSEAVQRLNREERPLEERDTYGKAFLQVMNIWRKDEGVRRFALARRFAQAAADLLGVDAVRMYHDQALYKEGGGGRTPWHQDQVYWPLDTDKTITMWMPLVDVPPEIGSMSFVSGSHAFREDLGEFDISDASDEALDRLLADRDLRVDTHGALEAGDATFHTGWILHAAPPNPTGRMRAVMTVIYFADGARVKKGNHPISEFDRNKWLRGLEEGELAASDLNPVLYSRA